MSSINKGSYKYRLLELCQTLQDANGVVDGNKLRRSLKGKDRTDLSAAITQLTKAGFVTKEEFAKGDYNLTLTFHSVTQFVPGRCEESNETETKDIAKGVTDSSNTVEDDLPSHLRVYLDYAMSAHKVTFDGLLSESVEDIKCTLMLFRQAKVSEKLEEAGLNHNAPQANGFDEEIRVEISDFTDWLVTKKISSNKT
jgi:DNA-binding HxlR family transcriptional regulator